MVREIDRVPQGAQKVTASAILCTYRRGDELAGVLSQLLEQNTENQYEIIVVDQKPRHSGRVLQMLRQLSRTGKIKYYEVPFASLTKARNFAAKKARSDILVFLDDDVIICDNFVERHLSMYRGINTHAVAGRVLDASGAKNLNYKKLHGTNFSVLREVYFAVGGSDETLGIHSYTEDIIFSERLLRGNKNIAYCSDASLRHLVAQTGGCRITDDSQDTREWEKSFSRLYLFYLRKAFRTPQGRKIFWDALRDGPLRKNMVVKFWLQPRAWLGFFSANAKAAKAARGKTPR